MTRAPVEVVEPAMLRRIALVMYAGADFGLLCAILGPDPDPSDHAAFWLVIALTLIPIAVFLTRRTITLGLLRASSWYGVAITCLCVAVARPTNGVPLYTVWLLLLAAYALPRRDFFALLGGTIVGLGIAIGAFLEPPARLNLWLDSVLTVGFAALVVRYLRERLDALLGRLQEVARRLHDTARRDPLTGLPNRRAFTEALQRELERAERSGRSLSLVLMDLDHFKQINDTHGHVAGDETLRRFADVARRELADGDALGRIGGEEFALALFDTGAGEAGRLAERIAGRLRAVTARGPVRATLSGGVAERSAAHPTAEALIDAADRALYRAKEAGRRRIAVARDEITVGPEVPAAMVLAGEALPALGEAEPDPLDDPSVAREGSALDERPLMRRVAAYQSAAGVPAMAASALLPDPTSFDLAATGVLCAVLTLQALGLLLARSVPLRVLQGLPFAGVLIVAAAVAINDPISGTPFFFVWPAVYAAYFFSRRYLVILLVAVAVSYALVLALWVVAPLRTSDFTTVLVPVVVAAASVAVLRAKVRNLVTQLRLKLAELEEAATHDPLTGVLNRRAFDSVLAREVHRARRAGLDLSLVLFDVDHFKEVNDSYGHAAGDEALRTVADALARGVRAGDVVARLGGEEFGVILAGTRARDAVAVADAISGHLAQLTAGGRAPVTMSAGVAELSGTVATSDQLLVAADRALYAAKASGRARTAVSGHSPSSITQPAT